MAKRVILAMALALQMAQGQQSPPILTKGNFKFTATTQLVIVNVSVKEKDGTAMEGLKASDFTVLEDGKPQKLSVFEYQRLEEEALPGRRLERTAAAAPSAGAKPVVAARIASAGAGEVKYKDRRLLVLFFDQASMPVSDQIRAQKAALKFLESGMKKADVVAVMTFATDLRVAQDFTGDRDLLTQAVNRIGVGETGMGDGSTGDDAEADTGDAFTGDDSEFNIFNTDRKLAALESAVKMLGGLPEKKALVYFASGMNRTGLDNQAQLRATINAAIRSNVAFYPVDARGLVAAAPIGDATKGSPGGRAMYTGSSQRTQLSNVQNQQETLDTLASDTGGKALLDNNDLSLGIAEAQKGISSYYILGYYSTNEERDGRYRRIKVSIGRRQARLEYRPGYFASKEFRKFTSSDRERQLQEALMLGDPVTDLTLAAEVNYFRRGKDRYFVPVAVKIRGTDIEPAKKGGESTRLDFIGEVRDGKGVLQGAVRDEITVKLKGEAADELARRNLAYDTGFMLPPGAYTLKFLARENETGKMGTFETKFTIPDLTAERKYLPVSSVVLSNQRESLDTALATAEKNRKLIAANPLVEDRQKLIPSVTRVFRQGQEMYVYLEAYQRESTGMMAARVSFFRGKVKAFESAGLAVKEGKAKGSAVPVRFSLALGKLRPGRYICQVSVVDAEARKFAVWRSAIVLLP